MTEDYLQAHWGEVKQQVLAWWDELPPQEVERSTGERDDLISLIQKHYGLSRDVAARQIVEFERKLTANA